MRSEGRPCHLEPSNTPFMNFALMNGVDFENLRRLGEIFRAEDPSDEDVATQLARMKKAEMVSSTCKFRIPPSFLLSLYIYTLHHRSSPPTSTSTHPG